VNPKILANDFKRAVAELQNALATKPRSRLEQAGCIQYFEFCFELAWKVLKSLAAYHGLEGADSPRGALRIAFGQGWLDDETVWLEMLDCRNRMSHTYNADSALDVFVSLDSFLVVLAKLDVKLTTLVTMP
jgi:nucleotidyltransferase substrate binding protein (TIGR01987 family)